MRFNGIDYIGADDIINKYPKIRVGCKSPRNLITVRNIPTDKYVYCREKNGKWIKATGTCYKLDKLFIAESWLHLQPEYINTVAANNDTFDKTKNITAIISIPEKIELNEGDHFKDEKGNILDIEIRGERSHDKCYFKASDIVKHFNIKKIHTTLTNKDSGYQNGIHYRYFYVDGKNKTKKLYITYKGLLKVLFGSRNKIADIFTDWAASILFAAQMGTETQRIKLASNTLGVSYEAVKEVINRSAYSIPCIYLYSIGRFGDVKKQLGLENIYDDNDFVYKWGKTNDLARRTEEHKKTYASIKNSSLELVVYGYVDIQYISKAEKSIKNYLNGLNVIAQHEKYQELAVIPYKNIKDVRKQYKLVSQSYAGRNVELIAKLEMAEMDKQNTEKECRIKLLEKDGEIKLLQKNVEILELNHKNELLSRDLEVMKLRLELESKK